MAAPEPVSAEAMLRRGARAGPVLVLLVALGLTGVGWALAERYVADVAQSRFEADADQLEIVIKERMSAYEEMLLGARGLLQAAGTVSREQWRTYVESLELERNYPGVQGLGFSLWIAPEDLDAHKAAMREEFPGYTVYPAGQREEYTSIIYLEPFRDRNLRAFGYDMYSEPTRRAAMERARDAGVAALSGKVTLVQENGTDPQNGFLMYVAYYNPAMPQGSVEERREALVGYVYSPFRAGDLMKGILRAQQPAIEFELYDGSNATLEHLLYDSDPSTGAALWSEGPAARSTRLSVAGHTWTLRERASASSLPDFVEALPIAVLGVGILSSALLFGIAWSLATTRQRAVRLAEAMTVELRQRTADLQATNDALQAFTYVVSHDLKEPVRGIEAYLHVLQEDHGATMDPEAHRLVGNAHEASTRLAALLNGLLQLSRVNREGLVMQALRVSDAVASDACRLAYERLASERGARVEVAQDARVLAAPSVLTQALGNLIANGIRHNASESPLVRVRARQAEAGMVEILVEDNGGGFPPHFLERFRAGGRDLPTGGFGLLIAQRAVERLGGQFSLERSDALGGAAVRLTLRAAR